MLAVGLFVVEGSLLAFGMAFLIPVEIGIITIAGGVAVAVNKGGTVVRALQSSSER
jgi:hypothetical protein